MSPAFTHPKMALLVLTSHSELGDSGKNTGYTVSEAADPWRVFVEAGWGVHVASVAGGRPPADGLDLTQPNQQAWTLNQEITHQLESAPSPEHVNPAIYDVIYFVGGHGAMWDFPDNGPLAALGAAVYERGGVVAAVCHGPAVLTTLRLSNGSLLIDGRKVSSFTDSEEKAIHLASTVPFLLQSRLTSLGAVHSSAPNWAEHVVTDGRLVTGQNPASAAGVATAAIAAAAG
ncbi:type 1 glutamine amidotransferase domain-containing protein [Nakamurella silvestris]|nr:type 1 glutamine amidotransferase domain-containing protein [Nakamurella silvestris]